MHAHYTNCIHMISKELLNGSDVILHLQNEISSVTNLACLYEPNSVNGNIHATLHQARKYNYAKPNQQLPIPNTLNNGTLVTENDPIPNTLNNGTLQQASKYNYRKPHQQLPVTKTQQPKKCRPNSKTNCARHTQL